MNELKKDLCIGIAGCGYVGGAISKFLINNNYNTLIYDKYKNIGSFDTLLNTDILYICLPTLYSDEQKNYDMKEIDQTIQMLNDANYRGIILIKSTIIPTYCSETNNKYSKLKIIHNPEFLSARTAYEDVLNQTHIVLGYTSQSKDSIEYVKKFYFNLYPNSSLTISVLNSEEAGLMKLACNTFYAIKVQYFTEIYLLCKKLNISYENVKNSMLKNNFINPMHTLVPGHDGNISYGGACFPKDTNALNQFMIDNDVFNGVINETIKERNIIRKN